MSKESEFVDLLNREMERLQGFLKGKKEPQTAKECEELVRPFVYKIEELIEHNYIKDQQIAELEEQLKNAIILPKYNKGQKIYYISDKKILEGYFQTFDNDVCTEIIVNPKEITDEDGYTDIDFGFDIVWYKNTFATKEEAQAKLKELQGE